MRPTMLLARSWLSLFMVWSLTWLRRLPATIATKAGRAGLLTRFIIVGLAATAAVASGSAWFIEQRLTEHVLDLTITRAVDQVELGVISNVNAADFSLPFTPERSEQLAARLDVYLGGIIAGERGVLRVHLFAPDGTVIYSDLAGKRGSVQAAPPGSLLEGAFAGVIGSKLSSLSSHENVDLKQRYDGALEIYVPVVMSGKVVGAYEIYTDLAPLQPIRPLVWVSTVGGFTVLFVSLFMVIRSAASMIHRQQAEREALIFQNEERFRALVGNTSDVIAILDGRSEITYVSPQAERAWGCAPDALAGVGIIEWVHEDDRAAASTMLAHVADRPGLNVESELRLRAADGDWHDFEVIAKNLTADAGVGGIVVTFHDITQRKAFERDLQRLAFHDTLSGLPNRALFHDRLERALARADRHRGRIAVMFLDLDNFKVVNDSLGHDIGDQLLVTVSSRLRDCLRIEDTAARLGGDELAVILEDIADEAAAIEVTKRIIATMAEPIVLNGRTLFVTFSIGIALSTPGRDRPDTLLRNADLAMYRAKANGKARFQLFDPSMTISVLDRLELESDLRSAQAQGHLRVVYQPIMSLESGCVIELEALLRWDHPTRGLISPDQFIPLAEETGLIVPIGQWVLEDACRRTRAWHIAHPTDPPVAISVNLSARQFMQADLVDVVERTLHEAELDPTLLKLEITETVLMRDIDHTVEKLWALKRLGVHLAIDDFGTGYSSLSYLKRFPVDTLKIDRSFVSGLGQDANDTAIVRSVVALAKSLNLAVTGEGIETNEQLDQLQALGCDRGQGFLFARPMHADDIDALLANGLPAVFEDARFVA